MAIGWDLAAALRFAVFGVRYGILCFGVLRFESVLAFLRFGIWHVGVSSEMTLNYWKARLRMLAGPNNNVRAPTMSRLGSRRRR